MPTTSTSGHTRRVEQLGGRAAVVGRPFEERVRRNALPLPDVDVDAGEVERGVVVGAGRALNAVRRPRVDEVRHEGARAMCPPLSLPGSCQSRDATTIAYSSRCATSQSVIPAATAAPPSTPSAPPSVKSFWTSTMKSALRLCGRVTRAARRGTAGTLRGARRSRTTGPPDRLTHRVDVLSATGPGRLAAHFACHCLAHAASLRLPHVRSI